MVHGINDIATIQLEEQPTLNTEAIGFQIRPTKRPSTSHWLKGNITTKVTPAASVLKANLPV